MQIYLYSLRLIEILHYLCRKIEMNDDISESVSQRGSGEETVCQVPGNWHTALPYKESDVDFSEYFDDVIGVTVPDVDAEDIVIKVTGKRFNYIRTKPLHLSQRIIEESEGYAIISINVKVNKELESLILSFGDDMEVIAPASFRDKIAEKIQATNKKYTEKNIKIVKSR